MAHGSRKQRPSKTVAISPQHPYCPRYVELILAVVFVFEFSYVFIVRPEFTLESHLQQVQNQQVKPLLQPSPPPPSRFVIFLPTNNGQGIGNIMNGLLAAHLLADEFNRTLCVSEEWHDFYLAFVPLNYREECAKLPNQHGLATQTIRIHNFENPPDECFLKEWLASDTNVLYFVGNTYPRWRNMPEDNYWDKFYAPTDLMKAMLPWKGRRPTVVVHLRRPDGTHDARKGLDDETLSALGKSLPNTTFLVTNNVEWYSYFKRSYHWANPGWSKIHHSAFSTIEWGSKGELPGTNKTKEENMMELWCDWYTILMAERVVHTHSDFSLSAIHWRNLDSKTIVGVNNGILEFCDEPWRREQSMKPLVDRQGTELNKCQSTGTVDVVQDEEGMND